MDIKLTYEDYKRFPQDGKIHEIIDGNHYNHPAPRIKHQIISLNLDINFAPYINERRLGRWFHFRGGIRFFGYLPIRYIMSS